MGETNTTSKISSTPARVSRGVDQAGAAASASQPKLHPPAPNANPHRKDSFAVPSEKADVVKLFMKNADKEFAVEWDDSKQKIGDWMADSLTASGDDFPEPMFHQVDGGCQPSEDGGQMSCNLTIISNSYEYSPKLDEYGKQTGISATIHEDGSTSAPYLQRDNFTSEVTAQFKRGEEGWEYVSGELTKSLGGW